VTAAVREMLHIAFGELGLHRVQAGTMLRNERSQRVLERAGFARYGVAPAYLKIAGRWEDHILYQILNPDQA
jgi:[ribosomal protein S5]-alanine N-acetyltransferase